ncbi:hypothetical protein Tco_1369267 [Tanacetum coccineum]|uniref:GAG-pre-integrase domain-containing protein n=1 Tax=Tanacetum coccineum TaxID=301880 RepID=A0ABQ4WMI2_9ASTR
MPLEKPSLNKDFGDFVRNFNMHCVGKTVSDLHALLIDYEKGLKDKAPTPQLVTRRGTALFTSKSCAQIRTRRLSMVLQLQGFRVERKLSYGEQYLHVGNGAQAAVEAIGVFNLVLPSGLVLSLNNCHYAPSIIRGVVSFSRLLDLGFVHTVTSNGISVSSNGIFYFSAISVNVVDLPILARLGMQKLQREGLLESINDGSYDKCESCISGKMTKKPFN